MVLNFHYGIQLSIKHVMRATFYPSVVHRELPVKRLQFWRLLTCFMSKQVYIYI